MAQCLPSEVWDLSFSGSFESILSGECVLNLPSIVHQVKIAWGRRRISDENAFTDLEMIVGMAMVVTLAVMSMAVMGDAVEFAHVGQAIEDLRTLQTEITRYEVRKGALPASLQQAGLGDMQDPWGNPYQYLSFDTVQGEGAKRKDKFHIPLSSTYDLYSMGKDGDSVAILTARASKDDIVRANDGAFIGLATQY